MKRLLILLLTAILAAACNKDEVITTDPLPTITLDNPTAVYTLKCGRTLTLSPAFTHAQSIRWILDGRVVGEGHTFTFTAADEGTFYLVVRAENPTGHTEQEMRIEVMALQPPRISFAVGDDRTLTLAVGQEYTFAPEIVGGDEATFRWLLDGVEVGTEQSYTCLFDSVGEHTLTLRAENEDGSDEQSLTLRVVEMIEGAIHIEPHRTISLGRTLWLEPVVENFSTPTFEWYVDGVVVCRERLFGFKPDAEGEYQVQLLVADEDGRAARIEVAVECCPVEGTFFRAADAESRPAANRVYEYTPAPGQFINEPQSGFASVHSAAEAIDYAEQRLGEGRYLSLGGFGGYVVVGFDHSIPSREGGELSVAGNMYEGSSEAGIVWVMQDSNGNGLPDDEWYELRGSEWGSENHSRHYAVTYFRPAGEAMNVQWRDSEGHSGTIARNNTHTQPHYYPEWITSSSYTLRGSRLEAKSEVDPSTGNVVNGAYGWGYADNAGSDSDLAMEEGTPAKCYFNIANAVMADGSPAELHYIDFVKIQTAINHSAGALGEISTEVMGIVDESM